MILRKALNLLIFLTLSIFSFQKEAAAQSFGEFDRDTPVVFSADTIAHDDQNQIVTAKGNVEIIQNGRILKADQISYDMRKDRIFADGNIVLSEVNGDTYFADALELSRDFKEGFVEGLQILLADGSRFKAETGNRIAGRKTVMEEASYTPCEVCEDDPIPLWALKAKKVTHDNEDKRIQYENAWFELAGLPVAYLPFFSHPDGTVEQKSGFLAPSFGFDSQLGGVYAQEYYWGVSPSQDATFGAMIMTEEAPLAFGQYRKRFETAMVDLKGGITYSRRNDSEVGRNIEQEEEVRGHLLGSALWDMNEKWRSGLNLEMASDDQYLRQYDFSNKDVLENELFIERFSGRNYGVARLLAFQDVRVSERQTDQPNVLPEIQASFIGAPNSALGGRFDTQLSTLGLRREGEDQDLNRATAEFGWERQLVSRTGLVSTIDLNSRADYYNVRDRDAASAGPGLSGETNASRGFAQAHLVSRYPLQKNIEGYGQALVEPIASVTVGTNVNVDTDIPNEDSQDVQIDASGLFEANRFTGYDRIEDRSRVTYGLRTGYYSYGGQKKLEVFLGQSYRFDSDDNPFPEGSGLSDDKSDYVGKVTASLGLIDANYRFQLNEENFSSQRHEAEATTRIGPLELNGRYFYSRALAGTDLDESREQFRWAAGYRFSENWRVRGSARHDFAENRGLRRATLGFDYTGQCISFSASAIRNLTEEFSGDSSTEIMFRLGLKNLGEFETSGLDISSRSDEE